MTNDRLACYNFRVGRSIFANEKEGIIHDCNPSAGVRIDTSLCYVYEERMRNQPSRALPVRDRMLINIQVFDEAFLYTQRGLPY